MPSNATRNSERAPLVSPSIPEPESNGAKSESPSFMKISEPGVYLAVFISAFGGVSVNGSLIGSPVSSRMHPFLMTLLAIPIFIVQISAILALRFDLDITSCVRQPNEGDSCTLDYGGNATNTSTAELWAEHATSAELTQHLKLLMVLILQLTQFNELVTTVRYMALMLNPISWLDIYRPPVSEWLDKATLRKMPWLKCCFHPAFMMPWPFIALVMRFCVGYLVCVDSMSLILSSTKVKDTIFNSLAMTFIVELNRIYLNVCKDVFHLEVDEDPLRVNSTTWTKPEDAGHPAKHPHKLTTEAKEAIFCPALLETLVGYCPFLRWGYGAKTCETVATAILMFIVYMQQLFVLIFAYATNTLPVARDVCTQWRMMNGQSVYLRKSGHILAWGLKHLLLVDAEQATNHLEKTTLREECNVGEDYFRMGWSDRGRLVYKHPLWVILGVVCILSMLMGPQTAMAIHTRIFLLGGRGGDDEDLVTRQEMEDFAEQDAKDQARLQTQIDAQRTEMEQLKTQQKNDMEELRKQIEALTR
mmetsp:Transcript_46123/g.119292  ORF Transcript_46123/g.119292 Transcript_46123/m.119292 type:complete len:531 (+) Transcript_46123:86-1678(+)